MLREAGHPTPNRCPPHGTDWGETGHLFWASEEEGKALWKKRELSRASKDLTVKEQKVYPQQRKGAEEGRRGGARSSKVGLRKRREGEGELLGLQHPL